MATRDTTFTVRMSHEEKTTAVARAASYGMSPGDYARHCLLNSPPPPHRVYAESLPTYDTLVSQVQTLAHSHAVSEAALNTLATADSTVADALQRARTALGPREE